MRHIIKIWAEETLDSNICYPEMEICDALVKIDTMYLIYYQPYYLFTTDDSDINMYQIATLLKDIKYDFRWATIDDELKDAHTSIHRRNGAFWLNYSDTDYDMINSVWDSINKKYLDMVNERR